MKKIRMRIRRTDQSAVSLAEEVLVRYGLREFPVDLMKIVNENEIDVVMKRLPKKIRAMSNSEERVIILSSRRSKRQRRFDLGHELAEIICPEMCAEKHDHWQNEFACHLLVPLAHLRKQLDDEKDFFKLVDFYDVTDSILGYQLKALQD